MTTFVDDNGNVLDYQADDGFYTTRQCANWYDFKIKGDVTTDLKIPNTPKNRSTLGYYGGQQVDSPAFPSQIFTIVRNGNRVMRGKFVIRGMDKDFIYCFFVSGNSNWFNALKFNLKDMVYPESYTVGYEECATRLTETDGIVFPLLDVSHNRQKAEPFFYLRQWQLATGNQDQNRNFSQEIFPCIYLHTVVSGISNQSGVKIDGTLVSDPLYKKIILTPDGPDFSISNEIVKKTTLRAGLTSNVAPGNGDAVVFNSVIESGEWVTYFSDLGRYYVARVGTYSIDFKIDYTDPQSAQVEFELNKSDGSTKTIALDSGTVTTPFVRARKVWFNAEPGDYVVAKVQFSAGSNPTINTRSYITIQLEASCPSSFLSLATPYTGAAAAYYLVITKVWPSAVVPDMLAVDFIKFLCIYFGCVCSYDEDSKTLSINKVSSLRKENAEDWSEFFIKSKEVYDINTAIKNYIQSPETNEEDIVNYNSGADVKYGGGVLFSRFDFTEKRTIYSLPFGGSFDDKTKSNPDIGAPVFLPYVKFYDMEPDLTVYWDFTSVTSSSGARFNGTGTPPFSVGDLVSIEGGAYSGYSVVRTVASGYVDLGCVYVNTTVGRITLVNRSKASSYPRMLVISDPLTPSTLFTAGTPGIYIYRVNANTVEFDSNSGIENLVSPSTIRTAWFDKNKLGISALDTIPDSLSIDQIGNKAFNATIGERYHNFIERAYNNPKIEAYFYLPTSVFYDFNFRSYVYLKTKDITGYFLVQKIENYKNPETPVKVELIYID